MVTPMNAIEELRKELKKAEPIGVGHVRGEIYDLVKSDQTTLVTCYRAPIAYIIPADTLRKLGVL